MSSRPLVSVCVPTYNRPEPLAVVIDDILAQTYPHIEIIVTDDGDPEPTRRALERFGDRVRYHANPKRLGIYGNWNRSIELARGELIAVYHDHDRYLPTIVERSVELFERSPKVGLVHVATVMEGFEDGIPVRAEHRDLPEIADGRWFAEKQAWIWPCYVSHGCMMVRAELYRRLGTFDESKGITADMDMLTRFALECDVGYVREYLYRYSGRSPKDELYGFRWSNTTDYIPVRRLNFERVYADQPEKLSHALAALQRQVDRRLIDAMLYLSLHDRRELLEQGWPILARYASRPAYLAARALLSDAAPMRLARSLGFAAHAKRKAWRAAHRAQAGT